MEIGVANEPSWLRPLLGTNFYNYCNMHEKQLCSKFCKDCMGNTAHCEKCTDISHAGHGILSVYRASHHSVLRVKDVNDILDTSYIHRYVINSKKVIFLQSRKTDKEPKNPVSKCVACGWELRKDGCDLNKGAKFCSVGCKLQDSVITTVTSTEFKNNVDSNSFKELDREERPEKIKPNSRSYRKRSRKGVPRRAPLF